MLCRNCPACSVGFESLSVSTETSLVIHVLTVQQGGKQSCESHSMRVSAPPIKGKTLRCSCVSYATTSETAAGRQSRSSVIMGYLAPKNHALSSTGYWQEPEHVSLMAFWSGS